ncbi:MAG: GNAT family N-acetyltransferase [Phycisphaerae bacterium]|nr:GNAT family N-acetyltransferase [Phycisphaerae bacterium]
MSSPDRPDLAALTIRRLSPTDPVRAITSLLHRAYAPQIEMGLRPLAGRQDDATTQRRLNSGEAFVAECGGRVLGVVILNENEPDLGPPHFRRPGVASFSQFAVDPDMQGRGVGRRLLGALETRARELGATRLALSMAEPDADLRAFYERLGYSLIETWQWPYTNYRSLILSKPLE